MARRNVHPFPARMAPELALEALDRAPRGATVLDPMCGSGTVLKHAVEEGHNALGFDLDPLAVLLSRVTCRALRAARIEDAAHEVVAEAANLRTASLPWLDDDEETSRFVEYWFAPTQRADLRRLAWVLARRRGPVADVLRVALSSTIVTKDRGASLARDVSHSRPHRVRETNDYDVLAGFVAGARRIALLVESPGPGRSDVKRGDARRLPRRLDGSVDMVVTSPPYLNAIDYMRGHRLSLVWLGFSLAELRHVRAIAVGAERKRDGSPTPSALRGYNSLSPRKRGMLDRYAGDIDLLTREIHNKLKPGGEAVLVVGDSTVGSVYVRNSAIVHAAAERAGLRLLDSRSRRLPSGSRYLPPPTQSGPTALSKRLRSEVVLRFRKAG